MDSFPTATQFHTAIHGTTSVSDVLDPYDAMILEYIEEKHIAAYSLLSHRRTTGISSENTLSTNPIETEINDLPVILPGHLAWAEGLHAVIASRYPSAQKDDGDDADWSVALGTYDYLEIEEAKHATACARIPWRVLDHLAEWRRETEEFAEAWDLLRKTELDADSAAAGTVLLEESSLECTLSSLTAEAGCIGLGAPPAATTLDELLPDLRGLEARV